MPSSRQVLLVDDEARLLSGLRRRLVPEFDVLTEVSATAALDLLEDTPEIAVVVVDMQMPEMSGIDFLREVERRAPDVVRLMLTGNADLETAVAAINDGHVMRFLRKPCDTDELRAALREAIAFRQDLPREADALADADGPARRQAFLHRANDGFWAALTEISELAQRVAPDGGNLDDDDMVAGLEDISHAGRRLADLARQVLDLKSLDAIDMTPEDVDVVELVRAVAGRVLAQVRPDDVTISVESLRRNIHATVCGPALRLALRSILARCAVGKGCTGEMSVAVRQGRETVQIRVTCLALGPKGVETEGPGPTDWEMEHLGFALACAVAEAGGFGCRTLRDQGALIADFTLRKADQRG